ncbi:hypothetical protein U1Q18_025543 [Sarracenia purpurea var. burkii]
MKISEVSIHKSRNGEIEANREKKPPCRPAKDGTKPLLQDPILRSDPMETEEAVLQLPTFPSVRPNSRVE